MAIEQLMENFHGTFHDQGKDQIVKFFLVFSRFEFALLDSGYYYRINANKVMPDWKGFVRTLSRDFNHSHNDSIIAAVNYLINPPPKIIKEINGSIQWANEPVSSSIPMALCESIKRVRNNLFHGGKFQGEFIPELSRNYELLDSSLIILDYWLSLNEDVRSSFIKPFEP